MSLWHPGALPWWPGFLCVLCLSLMRLISLWTRLPVWGIPSQACAVRRWLMAGRQLERPGFPVIRLVFVLYMGRKLCDLRGSKRIA